MRRQFQEAAKYLIDNDESLKETIFETDRQIDQKERDIENLCMRLLFAAAAGSEGFENNILRTQNDFRYGAHRRPGVGHCRDCVLCEQKSGIGGKGAYCGYGAFDDCNGNKQRGIVC